MDRDEFFRNIQGLWRRAASRQDCWVTIKNRTEREHLFQQETPGSIMRYRLSASSTQMANIRYWNLAMLSHLADLVGEGQAHVSWEPRGEKPGASGRRLGFTKPKAAEVKVAQADCPMCAAGVPARKLDVRRVRKRTSKSGVVYYPEVKPGREHPDDLIMYRFLAPAPAIEDLAKGEGLRGGDMMIAAGPTKTRGKAMVFGGLAADTLEPPEDDPEPRCECGVVACGGPARGPQHSHWCPVRGT